MSSSHKKQTFYMKYKVGVFVGGYSSEAGISRKSGKTVIDNLDKNIFDIYEVEINRDAWFVKQGDQSWPLHRGKLTFYKNEEETRFDVVFNAIHGHPGEDGYLQALFELNNIPHSSCGFFESALTFNKSKTNALAKTIGINIPKAVFITQAENIIAENLVAELGLPMFIKPNRSGSSFGVSKVKHLADVQKAIAEALKEDDQIVAESAVIGTEVGCGVVRLAGKTEAIAVTEIVSKREFFDFEAKYEGASEEITPARIEQELYDNICRQGEQLYDFFGLKGIVRIDFIIQHNAPFLIEINSIPGLSPASIVPQQLEYKGWQLQDFFGRLLLETIEQHK